MAIGEGSGDSRATQAAQAVVSSPLLEHSIAGASGILLNVTGGPDLTLHEMTEVAEFVTQAAAPDANIIVGAVVHPRPEVELRVTLIATGMPAQASGRAQDQRGQREQRTARDASPTRSFASLPRSYDEPRGARPSREPDDVRPSYPESEPRRTVRPTPSRDREAVDLPDDADPLDVPPFLRGIR
jgi:cell division protein FtsZ